MSSSRCFCARNSTSRPRAVPLGVTLPDPDDEKFLEVAVSAGSSALVTGNLRHYPADRRQGMAVLMPREFLGAWTHGGAQS